MSVLRKPLMACSPAQHGAKEGQIGSADGIQAGDAAPVVGSGPVQGVECAGTFALGNGGGQGVEVAAV